MTETTLYTQNNSHPMIYGSNRSVVRMIATKLPIDSGQRIYIQLPGSHLSSPLVSMGGILDITNNSNNTSEGTLMSLLKDPELAWSKATQRFRLNSIDEKENDEERQEELYDDPKDKLARDKAEATEKLSSLEQELSRLRSQIAMYTLMEESNGAPPPPPPPPPPLPPLPDSTTEGGEEGSDGSKRKEEQSTNLGGQQSAAPPTFRDINSEISSIKLRRLDMEKSPGGTPLRPNPRHASYAKDSPSMDDPAAVIAHALRKKFSHRVFLDSPDKENLDQSDSSFSDSPCRPPTKKLFD